MPLINCKVESKFKWMKHCVLSLLGTENADANYNNFIFMVEDKYYMSLSSLISKRQSKTIKTS